MTGHIIFLITFVCIILIFSYLDFKNKALKHENELKQLYIQDLEKKLRAETFIATMQRNEVPIKEIRLAVPKEIGYGKVNKWTAREQLAKILAEKMLEENVIKIKDQDKYPSTYYEVSIRFLKNS